jgi:hypothetical protein
MSSTQQAKMEKGVLQGDAQDIDRSQYGSAFTGTIVGRTECSDGWAEHGNYQVRSSSSRRGKSTEGDRLAPNLERAILTTMDTDAGQVPRGPGHADSQWWNMDDQGDRGVAVAMVKAMETEE